MSPTSLKSPYSVHTYDAYDPSYWIMIGFQTVMSQYPARTYTFNSKLKERFKVSAEKLSSLSKWMWKQPLVSTVKLKHQTQVTITPPKKMTTLAPRGGKWNICGWQESTDYTRLGRMAVCACTLDLWSDKRSAGNLKCHTLFYILYVVNAPHCQFGEIHLGSVNADYFSHPAASEMSKSQPTSAVMVDWLLMWTGQKTWPWAAGWVRYICFTVHLGV